MGPAECRLREQVAVPATARVAGRPACRRRSRRRPGPGPSRCPGTGARPPGHPRRGPRPSRRGSRPPRAPASRRCPARLPTMRVHLGSDHAGFELKTHLVDHLPELGHDVGRPRSASTTTPSDDYPPFVLRGGRGGRRRPGQPGRGDRRLGQRRADRRQQGARGARRPGLERPTATLCREHNDANVVSVGARMHTTDEATRLVEQFPHHAVHRRRSAARPADRDDRRLRRQPRAAATARAPGRAVARQRSTAGSRRRWSAGDVARPHRLGDAHLRGARGREPAQRVVLAAPRTPDAAGRPASAARPPWTVRRHQNTTGHHGAGAVRAAETGPRVPGEAR